MSKYGAQHESDQSLMSCSPASSILAQQRQIEQLILMNEEANARYKGLERILHKRNSRSPRCQSRNPSPEPDKSQPEPGLICDQRPCPGRRPSIAPSVAPSIAPSAIPSTASRMYSLSILSGSTTFSPNISRATTLASQDSFHTSPEELETCTGALRKLLSELEDTKSIRSPADKCESVREAYRHSLLSLEKIIPPDATATKKGRLHRMLFGRNSQGQRV